jgi:hypothetical protein
MGIEALNFNLRTTSPLYAGKVCEREMTKKNSFPLIFALDNDSKAFGELYFDDGEDLNVGASAEQVRRSFKCCSWT